MTLQLLKRKIIDYKLLYKIIFLTIFFKDLHASPNIQYLPDAHHHTNYRVAWINMIEFSDHILRVEPFQENIVKDKHSCAALCLQDTRCKSLNLIRESTENFICKLLETDKYRSNCEYRWLEGGTHYAIQVCCFTFTSR